MDGWLESLRAVIGEDSVTVAAATARLGGRAPRLVAEPRDVDAVRAVLAWAFEHGAAVAPVGGGTKFGWGRWPSRVDVALSTERLDRVLEHRHTDLTATVQAGASLAAVNAALGEHAQWIPLDPPHAGATIGGILASDSSGPRRHRFGAPRDLLIGVAFVTAEGTLAHAGGRVVKNVAGYDLGKLLCGSHGALGVIVEATFKLTPVAPVSRTVEVTAEEPDRLVALIRTIASSQLAPTAVELTWPPPRALVRFESLEAGVMPQAETTAALADAAGATTRLLSGEAEQVCWEAHAGRLWPDDAGSAECILAVGLPPARLGDELRWLGDVMPGLGLTVDVAGRAAVGAISLRLAGPVGAQAQAIERIHRRRRTDGGHAVVLRATEDVRAQVEPWGPLGDAVRVMQSIKREFDPKNVLSPGRWPFA